MRSRFITAQVPHERQAEAVFFCRTDDGKDLRDELVRSDQVDVGGALIFQVKEDIKKPFCRHGDTCAGAEQRMILTVCAAQGAAGRTAWQ